MDQEKGWSRRKRRLFYRSTFVLLIALFSAAPFHTALAAVAPDLGTAVGFAVLGGSTVTNTGATTVTGDLGVSPGTAITGFPPGTVIGTTHAADATAAGAQSDTTTAYNALAAQACDVTFGVPTDIGGMTLVPGVYCFASSVGLTGILTLDGLGDPNAVWVFKIGSTLITASGSSVVLTNGAQKCNVFWQVGSSATLGTATAFIGNILALTSITLNNGATLDGRALARNGAVTMDTNTVNKTVCVCDVDGEACDDGNACTTPDTCDGGVCIGGPVDCGDGDGCTTDSCVDRQCVHVTEGCSCTVNAECEDNNPCTTDTCESNVCVNANNTASCDDGLFCNGINDTCSGGICEHPGDPCSPGTECNDICNEALDNCVNLNGTICSAADACTIEEVCQNGVCVEDPLPLDCDDLNVCTDDDCDPQTGCTHEANATESCDDGNICTSDEACVEGVCLGEPNDNCVCTRTIGYYKTHCGPLGPAKYLPSLQDDLDLCGDLNTQAKWCAKLNQKGKTASLQLIWQLIAAILNGGDTNDNIDDVVAAARACQCSNSCSRSQLLSLASQLDAFNNSGEEFCGDGTTASSFSDGADAGEGSPAAGGCSLIRAE